MAGGFHNYEWVRLSKGAFLRLFFVPRLYPSEIGIFWGSCAFVVVAQTSSIPRRCYIGVCRGLVILPHH